MAFKYFKMQIFRLTYSCLDGIWSFLIVSKYLSVFAFLSADHITGKYLLMYAWLLVFVAFGECCISGLIVVLATVAVHSMCPNYVCMCVCVWASSWYSVSDMIDVNATKPTFQKVAQNDGEERKRKCIIFDSNVRNYLIDFWILYLFTGKNNNEQHNYCSFRWHYFDLLVRDVLSVVSTSKRMHNNEQIRGWTQIMPQWFDYHNFIQSQGDNFRGRTNLN